MKTKITKLVALSVFALCAGVPGTLHAGPVDKGDPGDYNYIMYPPSDQPGRSGENDSTVDWRDKHDAHLLQVISPKVNGANTTITYLPNQYFVVSDTPTLSFDMRGGALDSRETMEIVPQDWLDTRPCTHPGTHAAQVSANTYNCGHPIYYEIYQLPNTIGQQSAKTLNDLLIPGQGQVPSPQLLGRLDPRSNVQFPTIDTSHRYPGPQCEGIFSNNPNNPNYCKPYDSFLARDGQNHHDSVDLEECHRWVPHPDGTQTSEGAAARCWTNFTVGPDNPLSFPDADGKSGNINPVDRNMRFDSLLYPNLNGKYVFLIKMVAWDDTGIKQNRNGNGYLSRVNDLEPNDPNKGCPMSHPAHFAQEGLFESFYNACTVLKDQGYMENAYWIRAPKPEQIATSPTSLATNLHTGSQNPHQDPNYDTDVTYEHQHNGKSFEGTRVTAAGNSCRNDSLANDPNAWTGNGGGTQGRGPYYPHPPYAKAPQFAPTGVPASFPNWVSRPSEGRPNFGITNEDWEYGNGIAANLFGSNGQNFHADAANYISGDWDDHAWQIPLHELNLDETDKADLQIVHWGAGNNLAVGGAQFTTGSLPKCNPDSTIFSWTPYGAGTSYAYNGATNPFDPNGSTTINIGFQVGSNTRKTVKYAVYLDDQYVSSSNPSGGKTDPVQTGSETSIGPPGVGSGDWKTLNDSVGSVPVHNVNAQLTVPTAGAHRVKVCYSDFAPSFEIKFKDPSQTFGLDLNAELEKLAPRNWGNWAYSEAFRIAGYLPGDCSTRNLYINPAPTVAQVSPANGARINYYSCFSASSLRFTVDDSHPGQYDRPGNTDPDPKHYVHPTVYLSPDGGASWVHTDDYVMKRANGAVTFQGSELKIGSKTLDQYIRENIPDGADVRWYVVANDMYGSSDVMNAYTDTDGHALGRNLSAFIGLGSSLQDNGALGSPNLNFSQSGQRYKQNSTSSVYSFHKNSRPDLMSGNSKKMLSVTGQTLTQVGDGQTVLVKSTFKNVGETPANYYDLKDYLGSVRDFDKPSNFSAQFFRFDAAQGKDVALTADTAFSALNKTVTPFATVSNHADAAADNPTSGPGTSGNEGAKSWRMDLGDNSGGSAFAQLHPGALNPGESVTITYKVDTDRNMVRRKGSQTPDPNGNFGGQVNVGDAQQRTTTDPKTGQTTSTVNELSDAHQFVRVQEDACNGSNRVNHSREWSLGSILSPVVRGGRGSIGTNGAAYGYDPTNGSNATFTVTAGGNLSHFTGKGKSDQFGQYVAPTGCNPGIDWRSKMTDNILKLKNDPHPINTTYTGAGNYWTNQTLDLGNNMVAEYKPPGGKVYQDADPNQPVPTLTFKGKATVIVNGDLYINVNSAYAPDNNGINSLGYIVLGNVYINPRVTNVVGNFYVSDVKFKPTGAKLSNGCPDVDASGNVGNISTGSSSDQLNVSGLMVARGLNLERYLANPNGNDVSENVYYDGRVVSNTPPGFGTFAETKWYEIAP